MKRETKRSFRDLAYYSSLGFQVSFSIIIGVFLGFYLDEKFNTDPWLMLICLGLGIAAGYRNIGRAIKRIRDSEKLDSKYNKGF